MSVMFSGSEILMLTDFLGPVVDSVSPSESISRTGQVSDNSSSASSPEAMSNTIGAGFPGGERFSKE